jgi:transglutaminase-like putative cysteine protease
MKVEAKIEPSGLRVTPEGLNVPGQRFSGTVEDNLIDGTFEVEHPRYNGSGAPPFPPDFSRDGVLREYLEPQEFIESDDPVLIDKAHELADGSKDAWEAATRLSEWVAENIGYAIPGGGTARKTYDIRVGECGAHSFLVAAFCRAVGIPARVVWGCMYISNMGGSFGQHAWNEIYMGDAGWVPVDATVRETGYLDSGHIRFGMYQSLTTSFNPHKLKILDYRLGPEGAARDDKAIERKYKAYLGKYDGPGGLKAKIFVQDGNLTVDIPGKVTLAFNEPDKEGRWYGKVTDKLFLVFEKDGSDKINVMNMHELVTLLRKSVPDEMDEDVPEELRAYLGKYLLPQLQAEFTVLHRGGGLAVYDPLATRTIGLQPPDDRGRWVDEFGKNSMSFDTDEAGGVTAMIIDSHTKFRR